MRGGRVEFKTSALTIFELRVSQAFMAAKKKKKNASAPSSDGRSLICENRAARFNYALGETFEAGIQLHGSEVKSCREGRVQIAEAYVSIVSGEVFSSTRISLIISRRISSIMRLIVPVSCSCTAVRLRSFGSRSKRRASRLFLPSSISKQTREARNCARQGQGLAGQTSDNQEA